MIPLNTPASLSFIGNDSADTFAITFPTFENSNIVVTVIDALLVESSLVLGTDFSLANIGIENTNASLTLIDASQAWLTLGKLATGYTLYIKFSPNASQPSRFRDLGRFAPESFEKALDRLTMSILGSQQVTASSGDLTLVEADVAALQASQSAQDITIAAQGVTIAAQGVSITALQGADTAMDSRVDALEANDIVQDAAIADHESRIDALEIAPPSTGDAVVELKVANFTAAYDHTYIVTGTVLVQLPAPVANKTMTIKIQSTGPVTLVRAAAEKIDFVAANYLLDNSDMAVKIVSDGTDFFII